MLNELLKTSPTDIISVLIHVGKILVPMIILAILFFVIKYILRKIGIFK